jgi:hypothetical protein
VSFAIIRGRNGRRHDVDFGDAEVEVDVTIGSETVQITVEAIDDLGPPEKRCFATMAIPREKFAAALGADLRDRHGREAAGGPQLFPRND